MYKEKLTIQGKRYVITHHDDGSITEDPPLPDSAKGRFADRGQEMRDLMEPCGGKADATDFHNNRGTLVDQLGGDEAWAKFIVKRAREKGAVITDRHTYISQLAREPGDPEAFVPPGEGAGYIRKLAAKRGKTVEGSVNYTPGERAPKKKVRLAEDLVRSQMLRYRATGEADKSISNAKLREMVIEKHGAKE